MTSRSYSGTTATLSYDSLDHFTEWNANASSREWYVYDASGNRVLRRSNNGTTTLTVYAFGLEEHTYTSTGQTVSNNKYYYTLAGRLIGGKIGSATQFLLTDALGSVVATISNNANSAAVQGNQVYDPYGHQRYKQGSLGTNKGFTGQYNDSLTGLDYYNARYYDQKVGVFLSADVVQGNVQAMNPYAYVEGNPETYNDPTGNLYEETGGEGGGVGDLGGSIGGSITGGGGVSDSGNLSGTTSYGEGPPDITVTSGGTTNIYDPSSGSITQTVVNADGSVTTTELNPGDPGYDNALTAIDGSGGERPAVNSLTPRSVPSTTGSGGSESGTTGGSGASEPGITGNQPGTTRVTGNQPGITESGGSTIEAGDGGQVSSEPRVVSHTNSPENDTPGYYLSNKAPKVVTPGTQTLEGVYVNDLGQSELWVAHYDNYGRMIGRTDYTTGNVTQDIEPIHYHVYSYTEFFRDGRSFADHVPGIFDPRDWLLGWEFLL